MGMLKQKITLVIALDEDMGADIPEFWDWETLINPAGLDEIRLVSEKGGKVKEYISPASEYTFG